MATSQELRQIGLLTPTTFSPAAPMHPPVFPPYERAPSFSVTQARNLGTWGSSSLSVLLVQPSPRGSQMVFVHVSPPLWLRAHCVDYCVHLPAGPVPSSFTLLYNATRVAFPKHRFEHPTSRFQFLEDVSSLPGTSSNFVVVFSATTFAEKTCSVFAEKTCLVFAEKTCSVFAEKTCSVFAEKTCSPLSLPRACSQYSYCCHAPLQ